MNFEFIKILVLSLFAICNLQFAICQDPAKRYEIDAKRLGVSPTDKDALPRSREFIRLDSTYYVGHYYEGMYKYQRAADFLGYKNCIAPLKKALLLFEKDNRGQVASVMSGGGSPFTPVDVRQICD